MPADHANAYASPGVPMQVKVRSKGTEVSGLEVLDLSLAGCMIHIGSWGLREDQRVIITLPAIGNLHAAVIWAENERAGLLFDQLLNEAVYEHLIRGFALRGAD